LGAYQGKKRLGTIKPVNLRGEKPRRVGGKRRGLKFLTREELGGEKIQAV